MATLQTQNKYPSRRKRTISSIYRAIGKIPKVGHPFFKEFARATGNRRVERDTREFPTLGLATFSESAQKAMDKAGRNGNLRDARERSHHSSSYARKVAEKCVELGLEMADETLVELAKHVSGNSKVGLFCIPETITNHELFSKTPFPKNYLEIVHEFYPDFSERFLQKFDDGSQLIKRAKLMLKYQQVAYDGKGSFHSPSYPLFDEDGVKLKGSELPLEVQLTKLVEVFSAVLHKIMNLDKRGPVLGVYISNCEKHAELAAATMVSVSGKDVSPELTAVLLSILFPPAPLAYTRMVVERLKHPDPEKLEKNQGEDLLHAKEVVANNELFKILIELKKEARIEQKEKDEFEKEELAEKLAREPTLQVRFDDICTDSETWDDETVPEHKQEGTNQ